jgi:hypothetical protein
LEYFRNAWAIFPLLLADDGDATSAREPDSLVVVARHRTALPFGSPFIGSDNDFVLGNQMSASVRISQLRKVEMIDGESWGFVVPISLAHGLRLQLTATARQLFVASRSVSISEKTRRMQRWQLRRL